MNKIPEEKVCSAVWGKGKHIEKKNTVYPNWLIVSSFFKRSSLKLSFIQLQRCGNFSRRVVRNQLDVSLFYWHALIQLQQHRRVVKRLPPVECPFAKRKAGREMVAAAFRLGGLESSYF